MKRSLLRSFALVLAVALLVAGLLSAYSFDRILTAAKERELSGTAKSLAVLYDPEGGDRQVQEFLQLYPDIRITIIAADGSVMDDSLTDYRTMENHADRDEILAAARDGSSLVVRNSSTWGRRVIYAVVRREDGNFIRVGQEYNGFLRDLVMLMPPLAAAALAAMLISFALSARLAQNISEPIYTMAAELDNVKQGDVRLDARQYPYEELRHMALNINDLAGDVGTQIHRLQEEKDKNDFLLDNLEEGFVLVDREGRIQLVNSSACRELGMTKSATGQLLSETIVEPTLRASLASALSGEQDCSVDICRGGRILLCRFTHVSARPGIESGLILTLADVTAARRAMEVRQEFFSNASHELKTPITALKGSAELLCSDLPLDESQRKELLSRIGLETDRMSRLIQDIIMISRIESGVVTGEVEMLDLRTIVLECAGEARSVAAVNGVEIFTDTQSVLLRGSRKNLYELVSNLMMNAVKYNAPGGRVEARLRQEGRGCVFIIRNDGEPIPQEQQERVFERFYRVDRGRSRQVGGTGLGLSIVKHVVDTMQGTITLTSSSEEGTRVRVFLPLEDNVSTAK